VIENRDGLTCDDSRLDGRLKITSDSDRLLVETEDFDAECDVIKKSGDVVKCRQDGDRWVWGDIPEDDVVRISDYSQT